MNLPTIRELCKGEINDFILELVQKDLNNIPPNVHNRRRELCEAILSCNRIVGDRARIKETMASILKTWSARKDEINKLEGMGFKITKGKTHFKMRFNESAYFSALPTSPGDHRTGSNTATHAVSAFF